MDRDRELETAHRLWKKLCELQTLLFDHYGDEFMDLYLDNQIEKAQAKEDVDFPF